MDADIAQDAVRTLELGSLIPTTVQAVVHNGQLTLTGTVEWLYQEDKAEMAVRHIRGVREVLNHVTVAPRAAVRDVRYRIVKALHQNADVDARHVDVTVAGSTATLTGHGWDLAAAGLRRTRRGGCAGHRPRGQPDDGAVAPRLEDGRLGRHL